MTRQHGYRQLDLISRALGTNIFVCSKTVYKDLVQCMTKTELRKIDLCIQRMFPGISPAKLYARPKKGGYGLFELSTQLLGHRAEVIGETLSQANGWFIQYLRVKMLHHMAKILAGNEHTRVLKTGGLHWLQFLLEKTDIFEKNLHWTFSFNEIHYIRAWREVTYKSTEYDVTKQPYITSESTLMETVADGWLPRAVAEKVSQVQYKSLSRKKQEALLPLSPRRFQEICPEVESIKRWEKFWKVLYKEEWILRHDLTALHLFNFGSYVPLFDVVGDMSMMRCHLCLSQTTKDDILAHIYNQCETTSIWWQQIGPEGPMHLNSMLAPVNASSENLRKLNWFVKTVKKVYSLRRRESPDGLALSTLSLRELKRQVGEVQPLGR
ncbi:hypothetical protein OXX80_010628 [Metschnikowia pulcherrima]